MRIARAILTFAALTAAVPASAQTYSDLYAREIARQPYYEVQRVPRYAPPRTVYQRRALFDDDDDRGLFSNRRRMQADPYRRQQAVVPGISRAPAAAAPIRRQIPAEFRRQTVSYTGTEAPGTIIINSSQRMLYLVQGDGTAIRYGIGVGREGFGWSGTEKITAKREWPKWYPPAEMLARRPDLPKMMEGGPNNPLGARAMYLGSTLYRIHGSNEPWTIGQAVSSGCFRMTNEDVQDLYDRVPIGATVKVI
ncbi:L,D-transpeptidase [Flaviflagellibacter deserti]|jgi:lipoprotein-anchoring transpeptidase ErfK/SrfK|uniref:L,D-transpeptidase n=1 Tax=Flaviflagellibacter deserti TaxID=2267266 RepID=A0ABV9YUN6_9HYPH